MKTARNTNIIRCFVWTAALIHIILIIYLMNQKCRSSYKTQSEDKSIDWILLDFVDGCCCCVQFFDLVILLHLLIPNASREAVTTVSQMSLITRPSLTGKTPHWPGLLGTGQLRDRQFATNGRQTDGYF